MNAKKEFLLFISIPAGIILIVTLALAVPSLFARPGYDFIYAYCPAYQCRGSIKVNSQGVIYEDTSASEVGYGRQADILS